MDDLEPRCSDTARARQEPPTATAPPASRLLLVEVPGPWGRSGLADSRLDRGVTRALSAAAESAGVRVQLIRRPGRHPRAGPAGRDAWAVADPAAGVVRWGGWTDPRELLRIDLAEPLDRLRHAGTGPQRVALVCTHARHDVCCAVRGRPVTAALGAAPSGRQIWETSHLGGDRFAANVLVLPEGEVFGGLDADSAVEAVRLLDQGRIDLAHHRGRVGTPPPVQAAVRFAAAALDDDRRDAVRVEGITVTGTGPVPDGTGDGLRYRVTVRHGDRGYRFTMIEWEAPPELLSCGAVAAKPARRFALDGSIEEVRP